jgi:sodium-dependent dicarboxylate transporter 2/3/5
MGEETPAGLKKYLLFFIINILLIIVLTAIQFIVKPTNIVNSFNLIDIIFLIYLACFIFFAFIVPRGNKRLVFYVQNLIYLTLFLLFSPFMALVELMKEIKNRLKFPISGDFINRLENWIARTINWFWFQFFKEKNINLKYKNKRTFISINQLIYDLPFLGLIFMGVIIGLVYWLSMLGDLPGTPEMDGYVIQFLEKISIMLIPEGDDMFLFFLAINLIAISFTQIINNTTILLIMTPLVIKIAANLNLSPVYFLLSVTMAASAAFMTPMASPINAIAYAGVPGVSLKKMFKSGFILMLLSCLWITVIFYLFEKFYL